jgi:hypothetical protein
MGVFVMPDLMPSRTLHVSIARPPDIVYEFIMTAERFPEWAPGFALSVRQSDDGGWVVETADGPMPIAFGDGNALGVADHTVTLRPGFTVTNPIRVLPNGDGAEVIFTLFQRPEVSHDEFEVDAATVQSDLDTLKRVVEAGAR